MSDSPVDPAVATAAVEPEGASAPAPASPSPESDGSGGGASSDNQIFAAAKAAGWTKPGEMPEWAQRRIDGLTARLRTEEQKHTATQASLEQVRKDWQAVVGELAQARGLPAGAAPAAGPGGATRPPVGAPPNIDELVAARAAELVAQQKTVAEQEASAARGRAAYGADFDKAIQNIGMAGDIPPHMVEIAMQTGAAEHILFQMGQNMDLASKIISLSPGAMAVEMAKLATPPKVAKVPVSKAPTPITPIGGASGGDPAELRDDLPMTEWLKRRAAQVAQRRVA